MHLRVLGVLALGLALSTCSERSASNEANVAQSREPDVRYVPTPHPVVDAMLEMAQMKNGDVLYDLGSGDGRIPIAAAKKYGVRAVGIDIDPKRISESREAARLAGVEDLVTFRQADLFTTDISEASVVTLYLLDTLNVKLRPKLLDELRPGARVVSHSFNMADWKPDAERLVEGSSIYLWTIRENLVPGLD